MESHSRWLVRVGAFLVAIHPFTPYVLSAANAHGIPVPEGWLPEFEYYYDVNMTFPFSPFRSLFILLILATPVLSTFPAFREHRIVRRCQIGLVCVLVLVSVLFWSGHHSETSIPDALRWGLPLLAGFWMTGMLLLGFDAASVGRVARILIGGLLFFSALLGWASGPRWAAFFMGLPICMLGAALMTTGELIYKGPKTPHGT
jgi:hypothetical protein